MDPAPYREGAPYGWLDRTHPVPLKHSGAEGRPLYPSTKLPCRVSDLPLVFVAERLEMAARKLRLRGQLRSGLGLSGDDSQRDSRDHDRGQGREGPNCKDRRHRFKNETALAVCCPQQVARIGALSAFTRVCDALWNRGPPAPPAPGRCSRARDVAQARSARSAPAKVGTLG